MRTLIDVMRIPERGASLLVEQRNEGVQRLRNCGAGNVIDVVGTVS